MRGLTWTLSVIFGSLSPLWDLCSFWGAHLFMDASLWTPSNNKNSRGLWTHSLQRIDSIGHKDKSMLSMLQFHDRDLSEQKANWSWGALHPRRVLRAALTSTADYDMSHRPAVKLRLKLTTVALEWAALWCEEIQGSHRFRLLLLVFKPSRVQGKFSGKSFPPFAIHRSLQTGLVHPRIVHPDTS